MISEAYFSPINEKIEEEVWKGYDKTKEGVKKDIKALKEWLDSQPHLPHTLSDRNIMAFLLIARGSIEKAKPKIDMYFTMRSLFPDVFNNSHPSSNRMAQAKKYIYVIPARKLNFDNSRLLIFKLKEVEDASGMDPSAIFAYLMNVVEIRLHEDFGAGHQALFDMEHCKFQHVTKVTPTFVRNAFTIGEKALTTRAKGIHVINAPKVFDQLFLLVKSIVSPKLSSKIFIHKDMKSVIDTIDKEVLPKDYGGNEKSLQELEAQFSEKFNEYKDFFDRRENLKVNEELRPPGNINDDLLGFHGSFRKLDVD